MLPNATWPSSVTICTALSVFSRNYLLDAAPHMCCRSMLQYSAEDPTSPHLCDTSHRFMSDITKCGAACVSVAAAPPHSVTPA